MTTPFPFEPLVAFGFLSTMLIAGVLFRATIPVFQKILFPASLIGGLLGLFFINFDFVSINTETVKAFAYHFFNISFISVGLTPSEVVEKKESKKKSNDKIIFKGSLWMALVQAVTFPAQALIGSIFVFLFIAGGKTLFKTFGFLLPLGFNEGPGQALSFGRVWETAGFADASTIGLAFATIGFFFAFFVGVPIANIRLKKEKYRMEKPPLFLSTGILQKGERPGSAGGVTIHSSNLDTLAFHFSQVGLVYMVTYFFLLFASSFLPPGTANMIWGFFFIFGLIFAIIFRLLINISPFSHLLDAPIQRRVTGFSVDYLIVSTGCAIELLILETYIAPILLISLTGGAITTLIVFTLGSKLSDYGLERSIAIYGVVTGTVSSGLMLLRIVDPELKTPVAQEIGFMNIFAVPVVGGLTCLINAPLWWGWSLLSTCLVFFLVLSTAFVFLLKKKF
jgi:glutamate:Na+ symporter, ESS family